MEKLHSDLEVMEICQVPQAVIYPKEFGTKKDIADFQDSVFYLSADAPVEYSRANLEQICVQKEFIPKTKSCHAIVTDGSGGQCGNYGSVVSANL